MNPLRSLLRFLYRGFFLINDGLERMHVGVLLFEIVLLLRAVKELKKYMLGGEHAARAATSAAAEAMPWPELLDTALFLVLSLWLVADILVRARRLVRGYDFRLSRFQLQHGKLAEKYLELVAKQAGDNWSGAPLGSPEQASERAREIAEASAQMFSLGTFGAVDEEWSNPEAGYLNGWLQELPECAYYLSAPSAAGGDRYCSVIVPVMQESFAMIRAGHLNTALAHLDRRAVTHLRSRSSQPYAARLHLMLYTQIVLPAHAASVSQQRIALVHCTLRHLAFLLARFFPDYADGKPRSVALIGETSSSASRALLTHLGWKRILHPRQSKLTTALARWVEWFLDPLAQQSPAGFPLYELSFEDAASRAGILRGLAACANTASSNVAAEAAVEPRAEASSAVS